MTSLPRLDFAALDELARQSAAVTADCACISFPLAGWESVPMSMDEVVMREVGTLRAAGDDEPTFVEYHAKGTRYWSADAPIAPRYFPYNRCSVCQCATCGRAYLRYTEAGGYYVEERIRALAPELLVDAAL
jgi:hypothetical protein